MNNAPALANPSFPSSPKQISYLHDLLAERDLNVSEQFRTVTLNEAHGDYDAAIARLKDDAIRLNRGQASRWINKLRTLPVLRERNIPHGSDDVPAGRYAIVVQPQPSQAAQGAQPVTEFYKVDRPTEGRWAGRVFVKRQAGDELYPVRDAASRRWVLAQIVKDIKGCSERYGRELGACGVCGRTLTNEDSRARGIGPVCAESMGW